MHKIFFLFVLASLVVAQTSQIYYISVGGNNNQDCSIDNPCSSISQAISVFSSTESNSTNLEIRLFNGTYTGQGNINLVLPEIEIIIQPQSSPVVIECENENEDFIFQTNNILNVFDISMKNCDIGIHGTSMDSSISMNSVIVENIQSGVVASGSGMIDNCSFINSNTISMYLENGNWSISNSICENVTQCIYFSSNDTSTTINIRNISISDATNGITSEYGNLILTDSNMNNITETAVGTSTNTKTIEMSGINITFLSTRYKQSLSIQAEYIRVTDCIFTNSSSSIFSEFGIVENCEFSNMMQAAYFSGELVVNNIYVHHSTGFGISVSGSVAIFNSTFYNNSNSAVSLDEKSANLALVGCVFDSNYNNNIYGSAIYGYEYSTLNIENCTFSNNNAQLGTIYIPKHIGVRTYFKDVIFDSNSANYGAAIYCSDDMNIVHFESENSVVFVDNVDLNGGSDNTCTTKYGSVSTLYVNPSSPGNTSNCEYNSPCNSIVEAINSIAANSGEYINIVLEPGEYPENGNININFTKPTTIQNFHDEPVYFDCNGNNGFLSKYSFSISGPISFSNCETAIQIEGETLALNDVEIQNGGTGILFSGENLILFNVDIDTMNTGMSILSSVSISIEYTTFTNCQNDSIVIDSEENTSIEILFADFINTAGIRVNLGENSNYCTLMSANFTNIHTSYSILLNNGNWTIENIYLKSVNNGIEYNGLYENHQSYISFIDAINVNDIGISILSGTDFSLEQANFENITETLNINVNGSVTLKYCIFTNTGRAYITSNGSNAMHQPIFSSSEGITLTGGNWILYIPSFTNMMYDGDGGSIAMYSTHSNSLYLDNPSFNNSTASGKGGMLYTNGTDVSLDASSFFNGVADLGGAIYIDGGNVVFYNTISFYYCNASNGGAIFINNALSFSSYYLFFMYNVATNYGGGIYFEGITSYTASILGATFDDNSAKNGAAISCCRNSTCNVIVDLTFSSFSNNYNSNPNGTDVTCLTQSYEPNSILYAVSGDTDSSSFGMIIAIIAFLIACGFLAGIAGFLYYLRITHIGHRYEAIIQEED